MHLKSVFSTKGKFSQLKRLLFITWQKVRGRRPFTIPRWSAGKPAGGEPTDRALVELAKEGGVEGKRAFNILVERNQAWLVRYVYFLLGGSAEAEDVAQEALVRAYLALDRFRGESSFRGWLRPIATRLVFNHRRDSATRKRYEDMLEMPDVFDGGQDALISRDVLLKVLDRLSYPYREILVLRYVEELSVGTVAETLDIGNSAAKMRLSRARDGFWAEYRRMVSDGQVTGANPGR